MEKMMSFLRQKSSMNKKIPMRTCCGCRESFPKKELVRVVRQPDGNVAVDLTGKMNGRGAYICRNKECLKKAAKTGSIARALEISLSEEIYKRLEEELM